MTDAQVNHFPPPPLPAVDVQRVAPQNSAANPGAIGKGLATAGMPLPVAVGVVIGLKQTLADLGLIDAQTELNPGCVRLEDTTLVEPSTSGSSEDTEPTTSNTMMMLNASSTTRNLLQSLNNRLKKEQQNSQDITVENNHNALPEGDYASLKFALSVVSSALMQVNATLSKNAGNIAELNTIMGTNAESIYASQMHQQELNIAKQENAKGIGAFFGHVGHMAAYMAAAAIILAAIITLDPALLVAGIFVLAMTNSFVSGHTTDALAKGLGELPGLRNRPEVARILAEVIIVAAMIAACVLTGNTAGAKAELTEGAEGVVQGVDEFAATGSEIDLEGEASNFEAFEAVDAALDTSGGVDPNVVRLQAQMESAQINAAEKTFTQLVSDGIAQIQSFLTNLGTNPFAYNFVKAVSATSGVMLMAAGIGQATSEAIMAQLMESYAQLQANADMTDAILQSVEMRNQENATALKNMTQANLSAIGKQYDSVARAGDALAQAMYHV